MVRRNRRPTAPGLILKTYYLEPRELSITQFAAATGLSRKHVSNVVHGHVAITSESAFKFSAVLDTTAEFWLNLQGAVDLYDARKRLAKWRPKEIHPAAIVNA